MSLLAITDMIAERTGLYIPESRMEVLSEFVSARMQYLMLDSASGYLEIIRSIPQEFELLVSGLTINETYFYREPSHFTLLVDLLKKDILPKKKESEEIRIVSAGCSTGEEAYSIAIALLEGLGKSTEKKKIRILGFDIDKKAVHQARKGSYHKNAFRTDIPWLKEKYFVSREYGIYDIHDKVKDMVEFHVVNLLDYPYPEIYHHASVVFYRNVSIYFPKQLQKTIFFHLSSIMENNGYMFLSATETLSHTYPCIEKNTMYKPAFPAAPDDSECSHLQKDNASETSPQSAPLTLVEMNGIFLFKKTTGQLLKDKTLCEEDTRFKVPDHTFSRQKNVFADPTEKPFPLSLENLDPGEVHEHIFPLQKETLSSFHGEIREEDEKKEKEPLQYLSVCTDRPWYKNAMEMARGKSYHAAIEILDNGIASDPQCLIPANVLKAGIFINMGDFFKARQTCEHVISEDPLSYESYFHLGVAAYMEAGIMDNQEEKKELPSHLYQKAKNAFKNSIYVYAGSWPAHFYLARIYETEGSLRQAKREYENVIRILNKGSFHDHGLPFFLFSFSKEQLLTFCEKHLIIIQNQD